LCPAWAYASLPQKINKAEGQHAFPRAAQQDVKSVMDDCGKLLVRLLFARCPNAVRKIGPGLRQFGVSLADLLVGGFGAAALG
jgi:hypothetical protein